MKSSRFEDLSEQVYKALREMILKGELVPGQKLVQEALSERLGISRTPLLAAFSKLEKEMLVELVPRRGAFVKKLSLKELVELYEIRLRLEPLGASEAAARMNQEGEKLLREVLETHRQAVGEGVAPEIRLADYRFHMAIVKISNNSVLERILSSFSIVSKSNQSGLMKPREKSLSEHEALFKALADKDTERSERLMYDHLLEARDAAAKLASNGVSEVVGY